MKITIFPDILTTDKPYYVEVSKVFERIKTGNSKATIEKIRTFPDKKERDRLKRTLPSICFSGIFTKRAIDSIKTHTGLVCLDFDHIEEPEIFRNTLAFDDYTFAAFVRHLFAICSPYFLVCCIITDSYLCPFFCSSNFNHFVFFQKFNEVSNFLFFKFCIFF